MHDIDGIGGFLKVLYPLFIPVAVTVVHEFGNWRDKRAARPGRHFHRAHELRPAVDLVPATA